MSTHADHGERTNELGGPPGLEGDLDPDLSGGLWRDERLPAILHYVP